MEKKHAFSKLMVGGQREFTPLETDDLNLRPLQGPSKVNVAGLGSGAVSDARDAHDPH